MKYFALCMTVFLSLQLQAQDAFRPGPAIHFGAGLSLPFNDFPDEPAPRVLGLGYTLQIGYSAPARYSEKLSFRFTYKQFRNPLGGKDFGDPNLIATGLVRSNALLSDLMFSIGGQDGVLAQPLVGVGIGSTRTPAYLSSGNLITGGNGWMMEEHLGILISTSHRSGNLLLECRLSYLQMYYVDDISTVYEQARAGEITNLIPEISLVYVVDLKELLEEIQQ